MKKSIFSFLFTEKQILLLVIALVFWSNLFAQETKKVDIPTLLEDSDYKVSLQEKLDPDKSPYWELGIVDKKKKLEKTATIKKEGYSLSDIKLCNHGKLLLAGDYEWMGGFGLVVYNLEKGNVEATIQSSERWALSPDKRYLVYESRSAKGDLPQFKTAIVLLYDFASPENYKDPSRCYGCQHRAGIPVYPLINFKNRSFDVTLDGRYNGLASPFLWSDDGSTVCFFGSSFKDFPDDMTVDENLVVVHIDKASGKINPTFIQVNVPSFARKESLINGTDIKRKIEKNQVPLAFEKLVWIDKETVAGIPFKSDSDLWGDEVRFKIGLAK